MPPDTSFTITAPASSAPAATDAFVVSMLTGTPVRGGELPHDRLRPAQLFVGSDRLGSRSGRLAADVEQRGTRGGQREPVGDRRLRVGEAATVGERVGCDVDDPHERTSGQLGDGA